MLELDWARRDDCEARQGSSEVQRTGGLRWVLRWSTTPRALDCLRRARRRRSLLRRREPPHAGRLRGTGLLLGIQLDNEGQCSAAMRAVERFVKVNRELCELIESIQRFC